MTYNVLCTDGFSKAGLEELAKHDDLRVTFEKKLSHDELLKRIPEFDGLVVRSASTVSRDVIDAGKNLKIIARAGVGTDNIDIAAATERGILVVNAPAGNTLSTAELAFSLLLAVARGIPQAAAAMNDGKWEKDKGRQIAYKTLGIIGLGRIGREVARRAQAFKMKVVGFDPYLNEEQVRDMGIEPMTIEGLLPEVDFLTVHTPLTDETRNLIARDELGKMKKSAYLINCARGGIINEEDLALALREDVIAGAALDVYTTEPYTTPTFQGLANIVLTPHLGASTFEAQDAVAVEAAASVAQFFSDGISFNAVNLSGADPQSLDTYRRHLLLAQKVGAFAFQMFQGDLRRITVSTTVRATKLIALSAVRGVLAQAVSDTVTIVNAAAAAAERGIEVVEETLAEKDRGDAIGVRLTTADGATTEIWGRLTADGTVKIVRVNEYGVDIDPVGNVLVIHNEDRPGVIGRVCTILGDHSVNIAEMQNVRHRKGTDALTLIGVDESLSEEAIAAIRTDAAVTQAQVVRL